MSDIDIRSNLSEKEQERLAKIDKLDSNSTRKKLIFAAVTVVLITFFVLGTIFGGMYILSYEGTEALPEAEKTYSPLPEDAEAVIKAFAAFTEETKKYDGTKLDVSLGVNIPDESISLTGEKAEGASPLFSHIKSAVVSLISDFYENERVKGEYGTNFSSYLYKTDFTTDAAAAECIINEENENNASFIFTFSAENEKTAEIFSMSASSAVIDGVKDKLSEMVNIKNIDISYDSFVLTADINREKNIMTGVSQNRVCTVTAELEFIGEYSDFGTLTLSFKLEINKNYNFSRVEMYFTDDVFYVTKGASDEFKTKTVSDESPAETVLTFTSSNPEILSVDGRFFKANKVSEEPVTVSVEYTYKGVTYRDTCEFYVIVPVEGVKQNEKEISLKKGDEKALSVTVSPDDATLKQVYWFTTDENIASVDENGVVTAKNAGSASVYCITRDGNYKSSCAVEVSE